VFGPVIDPAGPWGLGVLETDDETAARELVLADPVIAAAVCSLELHPIDAIVPAPA
jgi:hypothetical protein